MKKHKKSKEWKEGEKRFAIRIREVKYFAQKLLKLEAMGLAKRESKMIEDYRCERFDDEFFEDAKRLRDIMKAKAAARRARKEASKRDDAEVPPPLRSEPPPEVHAANDNERFLEEVMSAPPSATQPTQRTADNAPPRRSPCDDPTWIPRFTEFVEEAREKGFADEVIAERLAEFGLPTPSVVSPPSSQKVGNEEWDERLRLVGPPGRRKSQLWKYRSAIQKALRGGQTYPQIVEALAAAGVRVSLSWLKQWGTKAKLHARSARRGKGRKPLVFHPISNDVTTAQNELAS